MGSDQIPDALLRAVADPYRRPSPLDCAALVGEVSALDAILGPDLDSLSDADKSEGVANMFGSAVRSLIPYRTVIRFLTGAARRERRVAAAIAAGEVRRAYLKGLGEQQKCAAPATPLRTPPTASTTPD